MRCRTPTNLGRENLRNFSMEAFICWCDMKGSFCCNSREGSLPSDVWASPAPPRPPALRAGRPPGCRPSQSPRGSRSSTGRRPLQPRLPASSRTSPRTLCEFWWGNEIAVEWVGSRKQTNLQISFWCGSGKPWETFWLGKVFLTSRSKIWKWLSIILLIISLCVTKLSGTNMLYIISENAPWILWFYCFVYIWFLKTCLKFVLLNTIKTKGNEMLMYIYWTVVAIYICNFDLTGHTEHVHHSHPPCWLSSLGRTPYYF